MSNFLGDSEKFCPDPYGRNVPSSSNIRSFTMPDIFWREKEIRLIITRTDERSKQLLLKFSPFDDIVADSFGVSMTQITMPKIRWRSFLPDLQTVLSPSNVATKISSKIWICFQHVPFSGWVRSALCYSDPAVESFVDRLDGLKLHVYHHLRTHVALLSWFEEMAKVWMAISLHSRSLLTLSTTTGVEKPKSFGVFSCL
jgi:hypothetical protein